MTIQWNSACQHKEMTYDIIAEKLCSKGHQSFKVFIPQTGNLEVRFINNLEVSILIAYYNN